MKICNLGGNEQIQINDINVIKHMKSKGCSVNINDEDFEKRKIYKKLEIKKLNWEDLFKNVDNKKRYYDDINEEKIDGSDTDEIVQLF